MKPGAGDRGATGDLLGSRRSPGSLAWGGLVFSLGFFSLAVQPPLFRAYLSSFDGSELGIGGFFGSWLAAVALGALAGRWGPAGRTYRAETLSLFSLLYLPALVLHHQLISDVRRLAGVAPYEAFPLGTMLAASAPANAPVGVLTGFLFTAACRSAPARSGLPVARVYILEALGGAAGGAASALLLHAKATAETVYWGSALVLSAAAALLHGGRPALRGAALLGLPVLLAAGLLLRLDRKWADANHRGAWRRLLPEEDYRGSLPTREGMRLYGERQGQFVVASTGGVVECLPDAEHASEILAAHLAQRPEARRVLVAGEGALSIALRFSELSRIDRIVWLHSDPDYPRALREILPEPFRSRSRRIETPAREIRRFLAESPGAFDLILLPLPDVTTLALNRYATREFFALAKSALAPGGLLSVKISGGENYLGGELAYLGSSMRSNLAAVFRSVAVKPGGETWLQASDGGELSTSPAVLRDRFASIPGAESIYPPEGVLGLYPPDRIQLQEERYARLKEEAGEDLLVNQDRRPRALLYGLAAGLRRGGLPVARHLPVLLETLFGILAGGILLYGILRALFLLRSGADGRVAPSAFDAAVLVFSTGAAGMGLSVVLLFLYQSAHGSLTLDVGLLSSLFMLGLALGGLGMERFLSGRPGVPAGLMELATAAVAGVLLLVHRLSGGISPAGFALLFALAGGTHGVFFPIAASRLKETGRDAGRAGSLLEMADHLGGAAGAVTGAILVLPVCGTASSLGLLGLLMGVNLLPAWASRRGVPSPSGDAFDRIVRPAAYAGLGLAGFLLWASQTVARAAMGREEKFLEAAARRLSAPAEIAPSTATLRCGAPFPYYRVSDGGYVFPTGPLVSGVGGYGGPINLAVRVDADGTLRGMEVLRSAETPVYLQMTEAWRKGLEGRNLFGPSPFAGVDAVTGATITSGAMLRILERAGRVFAGEVLGRPVEGAGEPAADPRWDGRGLFLAGLAAAALVVRHCPRRGLRRAILAGVLLSAGVWLNLQYSTHQVFSLLSGDLPTPGLTAAFFLAAVVPVLVALFGNIYCGWMCPFGAAQELAGELKGRGGIDPDPKVWRWGRATKYVLLAVLAGAFAWTRDPAILGADPLLTIFSAVRRGIQDGWAFGLGIAGVALSLGFRRFWCRNLCPAGAFLSLVGGVRLLRRIVPASRPGRCDLGVRGPRELDCLSCDRCRHETD